MQFVYGSVQLLDVHFIQTILLDMSWTRRTVEDITISMYNNNIFTSDCSKFLSSSMDEFFVSLSLWPRISSSYEGIYKYRRSRFIQIMQVLSLVIVESAPHRFGSNCLVQFY